MNEKIQIKKPNSPATDKQMYAIQNMVYNYLKTTQFFKVNHLISVSIKPMTKQEASDTIDALYIMLDPDSRLYNKTPIEFTEMYMMLSRILKGRLDIKLATEVKKLSI